MKMVSLFVFCFVLLVFIVFPRLDRPLEQDEAVTCKLFSSLSYTQTMEEMRGWPRFDFKLFVRGVGKCFLNDWDPNNHIVNSLAVSFSIFLFGVNEAAIRIPALIGAGAALFMLMILGKRLSGSDWFAGIIGVLLVVFPMFTDYAASARGYTITLALVFAQILWIDRLNSKSATWIDWTGVTLLSVALFANLASMLFVWVLPLYLFARSFFSSSNATMGSGSESGRKTQRQTWDLLFVFVLAVIASFILSSLREFLTAQAHYGVKADSHIGALSMLSRIFVADLFPGVWLVWAGLGFAGILITCCGKNSFWISRVAFGSLVFTIAYSLITRSVGYPRTYIIYAGFVAAESALLWRMLAERHRGFRTAMMAVLSAVVLVGVSQQVMARQNIWSSYNYLAKIIMQVVDEDDDPYMVLMPYAYSDETTLYLPPGSISKISSELSSGDELSVFLPVERMTTDQEKFGMWCIPPDRLKSIGEYWPVPEEWEQWLFRDYGAHRLYRVPMRASSVDDELELTEAFIGIWIAEGKSSGGENFLRTKLKTGRYPWTLPTVYYPLGNTYILAIFGSSPDDLNAAKEALRAFREQNGGYAVLLSQ